ncbi:helix-turn-helix domain-containing protein, partial [Marinobacterium arenosum]|uniref:helix-turn-helix domain-containing protein n=1 Tax=Marinobacterium arenosum TaxID=2862496 RepID=UPI001C9714B9
MSYQQLTEGKRYQISLLIAQGCTPAEIARRIDVNRSTVYRELKRNSQGGTYDPDVAQYKATRRRKQAVKYRVPQDTVVYVEWALRLDWSPEQISGVADLIGYPVSHEWIYRYVAADKASGGKLFRHLR